MGLTRSGSGDSERSALSDPTSGVAEGKAKGSASGLIDDPCDGCAILPTKIHEGSSTGLATREQAVY